MKHSMQPTAILAIEIGGTKLQFGRVTSEYELLRREEVDRARCAEGIRATIAAALPGMLDSIAAIGVGFGGPVDHRTGRVARSFQIEGWSEFPLGDWLTALTHLPVHVENDANAAAFAEATLGAGVGFDPVLYSNSGSGVGAGLVVEGRLYHGAPPGELELGHLRLAPGGDTVEDRCSGWSLDRRLQSELGLASTRDIAGNPAALVILDLVAADYAFGLSHAVHLLSPAAIVLGGGVALIGEPWRAAVARHLPSLLMSAMQPGPRVLLAALGEAVVPLGAAALARQRFLIG